MNLDPIITQVQLNLGLTADGIAGPRTWRAVYQQIMGIPAPTTDLNALIIAIQGKLGVAADGKPGPITWTAISKAIPDKDDDAGQPVVITNTQMDSRSEGVISKLHPAIQPLARQLVINAAAAGITIKVISGLRTYEEQDALYAQGRTTPGNIVSNAKGGHSNHNFGLAFDIGVFENGKYLGNSPKYNEVGPIGMALGLAWGGNWVSLKDTPHYELRPDWAKGMSERTMLAGLRDRKAKGTELLA